MVKTNAGGTVSILLQATGTPVCHRRFSISVVSLSFYNQAFKQFQVNHLCVFDMWVYGPINIMSLMSSRSQ